MILQILQAIITLIRQIASLQSQFQMSLQKPTVCSMLSSFICNSDYNASESGLVHMNLHPQLNFKKQFSTKNMLNDRFREDSETKYKQKNATFFNKSCHYASKSICLQTQLRTAADFEKLSMKKYNKTSLDLKQKSQRILSNLRYGNIQTRLASPGIYKSSAQYSKMQLTNATQNQSKPITNRSKLTISQNINNNNTQSHFISQDNIKRDLNKDKTFMSQNPIDIQQIFQVQKKDGQNRIQIMSFKPRNNDDLRYRNVQRIAEYKNTKNKISLASQKQFKTNLCRFENKIGACVLKSSKKSAFFYR